MEMTPEAVREGKFREALRGYHRDDVDEFLERVAAGIAVLQERLRQATDRAARAESHATEAAELDDSLRRTLVLAQRTADLAVEEARREAAQLLEEAQAHRDAVMAELAAERDELRERTQKAIQDEVSTLHETRERLMADVAELGQYYERQRDWLRGALAEQLRVLDEGGLDMGSPPSVHEVDPAVVSGPAPSAGAEPPAGRDEVDEVDGIDEVDDADGPHEASEPTTARDAGGRGTADEGGAVPSDNGVGADTAAVFLSELQRVIGSDNGGDSSDDDDVLPPPDEKARAFFDEDDEVAARRFGGLRRRRRRPG